MRSLIACAVLRSPACTARNSCACRSAMTLPEPDSRPLQPSVSDAISHELCVDSTLNGRDRFCSVRTCHSCCCGVPAQSLIAFKRRDVLDHPQDGLVRIALAGRQRILERDQRQVGGVGDALEMCGRHRDVLAHRERRRRKHQQRRGAGLRSPSWRAAPPPGCRRPRCR